MQDNIIFIPKTKWGYVSAVLGLYALIAATVYIVMKAHWHGEEKRELLQTKGSQSKSESGSGLDSVSTRSAGNGWLPPVEMLHSLSGLLSKLWGIRTGDTDHVEMVPGHDILPRSRTYPPSAAERRIHGGDLGRLEAGLYA